MLYKKNKVFSIFSGKKKHPLDSIFPAVLLGFHINTNMNRTTQCAMLYRVQVRIGKVLS